MGEVPVGRRFAEAERTGTSGAPESDKDLTYIVHVRYYVIWTASLRP